MRTRGPHVILVVGGRDSGKTTYVLELLGNARRAGLRVAGFYSEGARSGDRKNAYFLCDAARPGRRELLASDQPHPGLDTRVGRYWLSSAALARATQRIAGALDADLICMDEIGPLEMHGGGGIEALRLATHDFRGILLLTVRRKYAQQLERLIHESEL